MKSNKEYNKEDIFNNIQTLLDRTSINTFSEDFVDFNPSTTVTDTEMELSTTPAKLDIYMDAMKMHLYMTLKAPINTTSDITFNKIKEAIGKYGEICNKFVDWELVQNLYDRVFFEGEIIPTTIIAKGIPVEYQIPMYIKLKDSLNIDFTPKVYETGNVDFHKINSFIMVKSGEYIADIIPESPGKAGMNLLGQTITTPIKVVSYLTESINTVIKGNRVFSKIDGCLKKIGRSIIIESCLDIKTDVDYRTGDIEYNGDIHIYQTVREGFSIKSRDDIFIDKDLEPADITCGANLYVQQGIWGDSKYSISCNGILTSKHITHARIKTEGAIFAENSIVNSKISTLDKIILDKKGSIIGGEYLALNGIKTGSIGTPLGITTNIYLGIDYKVKIKLNYMVNAIKIIENEMNNLQLLLHKVTSRKEKEKIKNLFISLKDRKETLTECTRDLLLNLDKNEKSFLTVHGKVFPGTNINICRISLKITKIYENVEFSLDKTKGRIKWEYLD